MRALGMRRWLESILISSGNRSKIVYHFVEMKNLKQPLIGRGSSTSRTEITTQVVQDYNGTGAIGILY
jgi:hypothetical protein